MAEGSAGSDWRTVGDVGEKWIIQNLVRPLCGQPRNGIGVGDDAAVLRVAPGHDVVVSTDKIPEDLLAVRFGLMNAYQHGRYLVEVNVSDIGAMGAEPIALLANLALPNDFLLRDLRELLRGFVERGRHWGADVVGGDTGWGSTLCLSATALGVVPSGQAITRGTARPGDVVFVTGPVGGFGAALAYYAAADARPDLDPAYVNYLRGRLTEPIARIECARTLREAAGVTAVMDITDGLGQSLRELSPGRSCSALVDMESIPLHPATKAVSDCLGLDLEHIIFGIGLDLELLGALKPDAAAGRGGSITAIGEIVEEPEPLVRLPTGEVKPIPTNGWQHFAGDALEQVRNGGRHRR